MLRRFVLLVVLATLALTATPALEAQAQTPPQVFVASHLAISEAGPDLATVQGYAWLTFADGSTTGVAASGVTCAGSASPFTCLVPLPALTPGTHALTVEATDVAGASSMSNAVSFSLVVAPATPTITGIK